MSSINVLDCTLRDGGYCNQWRFGNNNIHFITQSLMEANIDIIELGFLTNNVDSDPELTRYSSVFEAEKHVPQDKGNHLFVCMINFGEYDLEDIPVSEKCRIDGWRVAFHKKDASKAMRFCQDLSSLGYKVFIQAMVTLNYSDSEFLNLIYEANKFLPYAFYIVDSFGVMKRNDLIRLFYLVEHNLCEKIAIGYHSHNNMQLAYSNAQELVDIKTNRNLIIDTSVFGMGRGAGNLNTELFIEHLNDCCGAKYNSKPLLIVIDQILNSFYSKNYWGYSLPNYLSAKHNVHPNYAGYLDAKMTLTVEDMDAIFSIMDVEKKAEFDKRYIEDIYINYLTIGEKQERNIEDFKRELNQKHVLIIAPGKSILEAETKLRSYIENEEFVSISLNFEYEYVDYVFLSNLRRYRELNDKAKKRCIVTSNIPTQDVYMKVDYRELLNDFEGARDNVAIMLLKYLFSLGINEVFLAGMDGYSVDPTQNYCDSKMSIYSQSEQIESMNRGISKALSEMSQKINIHFVTQPKYLYLEEGI